MNRRCVDALIDRALQFQKIERTDRAEIIYRGLIRRNYQSPRAFTNYGAIRYGSGCNEECRMLFAKALQLDPSYKDAWHNLIVDANLTNGDRLVGISGEILKLYPDCYEARIALAHGYIINGRYALAQKTLDIALEVAPDDVALLELATHCALALGDIDSAVKYIFYVLSFDPGNALASARLSEIADKAGDVESSILILKSALKYNPKDPRLLFDLARKHQTCGSLHHALKIYNLALANYQGSHEIMTNIAYCNAELGNMGKFFEQSEAIIDQINLDPEVLIPLIFICSTLGEEHLDKLREYSKLFWSLLRKRREITDTSDMGMALASTSYPSIPLAGLVKKRRIGILTGDLGFHVVSSFLASFLLNYSKDILEVEIISNTWRNDQVAEVLSNSVDKCISIAGYIDHAARNLLLDRKYDIILETSGFTSGTAINVLLDRCAPVQCHWIGYHASTYMPSMDYFIGDSILTPESHAHHFSEKLVRLKRAWLASTPFMMIPEAIAKKTDNDVIIGSFSQIAKLTQATLTTWARVMHLAPHVKLLLKDKFTTDKKIKRKLLNFFYTKGITPDRIVFMKRSSDWLEHMNVYNMIDLAMDTTPWSSATTAFDVLSMGVPMVALKGMTTSGLMSSSVLSHAGKASWVASSEDEYITKCLDIINDVQSHRMNKRDLQTEVLQSQLFDGKDMAMAIESFILKA